MTGLLHLTLFLWRSERLEDASRPSLNFSIVALIARDRVEYAHFPALFEFNRIGGIIIIETN